MNAGEAARAASVRDALAAAMRAVADLAEAHTLIFEGEPHKAERYIDTATTHLRRCFRAAGRVRPRGATPAEYPFSDDAAAE